MSIGAYSLLFLFFANTRFVVVVIVCYLPNRIEKMSPKVPPPSTYPRRRHGRTAKFFYFEKKSVRN